jgi:hypothetical protein
LIVLAIIPFFGGTSSATHSQEDTRMGDLEQTLESVEDAGFVPITFQSDRDKVKLFGSIRLDVDPIWLPYAACRYAQSNYDVGGTYGWSPDLVYVTEADQVLHMRDEKVLSIPNDTRYLAPWRLDLVDPETGEGEMEGAAKYILDGKTYGISNGSHKVALHPNLHPMGVVEQHAQQQAFSGAYLCTADFFRRIKFRKMRVLPVEHATGFDAKSTGTCVKTAEIERFFVDHLSPRDRHTKEVNE